MLTHVQNSLTYYYLFTFLTARLTYIQGEKRRRRRRKKHVGTLLEPITRGKIKAMNIEHVAGNAPPYLHARKLRAPISPEIEGHLRRKVQRQFFFFKLLLLL